MIFPVLQLSPALAIASISSFVMSPLKRDIFLFNSSLTLYWGLQEESPKRKQTVMLTHIDCLSRYRSTHNTINICLYPSNNFWTTNRSNCTRIKTKRFTFAIIIHDDCFIHLMDSRQESSPEEWSQPCTFPSSSPYPGSKAYLPKRNI